MSFAPAQKSPVIVWNVVAVESPCKLPCKRNDISKPFEISNWCELTWGLM